MFEIGQVGCGVYLCMLSIIDIRIRKLPVWILAAGGIAAGVLCVYQGAIPLVLAVAGAAVGIVFSVVSKMTDEGFGYGDSILILVLGIYLGFWNLLGVLASAFLLSAIFAMFALGLHKFDRSIGYPFVPFLCISYTLWLCLGGF
ncbi:prepilin peptidase [Faecalicatena sp. AGMB00832]|uniref:Prepilin peptidase n=1 Tax=Faecalicatena faecalis TaxID=2726362 RepID=A0ABS6D4J7_9FIRM|nr:MULTISPECIES: prepilin peptidase [Faecalicatena]MBU3876517.1 prepilin peptidase [Faecalicatena faecalis]MCI6467389.1 prepilin peptidase [Faecalicatena sp.]MDY5621015.1 prepilin peptidase [Lachnospiraceae bacterium]